MPQIFKSRSVCARTGDLVAVWACMINHLHTFLCEIDVELSRNDLRT
jgi:hypothetical protein